MPHWYKGNSASGCDRRKEPDNKRADGCRLVLTGVLRRSIRSFKSVGSFHSQLPSLGCSRPGNRNAPLALPSTESVLQVNGYVAAELNVAEILKFDRHCHESVILPKTHEGGHKRHPANLTEMLPDNLSEIHRIPPRRSLPEPEGLLILTAPACSAFGVVYALVGCRLPLFRCCIGERAVGS